jgi:hypothetical protein
MSARYTGANEGEPDVGQQRRCARLTWPARTQPFLRPLRQLFVGNSEVLHRPLRFLISKTVGDRLNLCSPVSPVLRVCQQFGGHARASLPPYVLARSRPQRSEGRRQPLSQTAPWTHRRPTGAFLWLKATPAGTPADPWVPKDVALWNSYTREQTSRARRAGL